MVNGSFGNISLNGFENCVSMIIIIRAVFTLYRRCFLYQLPVIATASTNIIEGCTINNNTIQFMEIQMEGFKEPQENPKLYNIINNNANTGHASQNTVYIQI